MIKMRRFYITEKPPYLANNSWSAMIIHPSDLAGSINDLYRYLNEEVIARVPIEHRGGIRLEVVVSSQEGGDWLNAYFDRPETEEDIRNDAEEERRRSEEYAAKQLAHEREHYERLKAKFEGKP